MGTYKDGVVTQFANFKKEQKVIKEALAVCLEELKALGLTEASKLLEKLKELNNE